MESVERDPTRMQEAYVTYDDGHSVRLTVVGPLEGATSWCSRCGKYRKVKYIFPIRNIDMPEAAEVPSSQLLTPAGDLYEHKHQEGGDEGHANT